MAERVGFEPTDTRISPVFKTGAFNHSTISPYFVVLHKNAVIPSLPRDLTAGLP